VHKVCRKFILYNPYARSYCRKKTRHHDDVHANYGKQPFAADFPEATVAVAIALGLHCFALFGG
jgi:hypothetical protein